MPYILESYYDKINQRENLRQCFDRLTYRTQHPTWRTSTKMEIVRPISA